MGFQIGRKMKTILINRYASTRNGTQSNVSVAGAGNEWHGLERPWLDNLPFESCIPTGTYALLPWESPRYGECYIFVGGKVSIDEGRAERYACLIHPANYTRQLQGCLALGIKKTDYHKPEDSAAVWSSRDALGSFEKAVGREPMQAVISWNYQ